MKLFHDAGIDREKATVFKRNANVRIFLCDCTKFEMNYSAAVLDTARSLVRIPSVNPEYDTESPGEVHVKEWVVEWAIKNCLDVETQEVFPGRHNIYLRLESGSKGAHLLLNGHMDTVAVTDMVIDPFEAEVKDGRLWGRGAADMKGPLASMMHALLVLKEKHLHWKGRITLGLVVDEECGFHGIQHLLKKSSNYNFAIVAEPTCFQIVRGCKGCLRFSMQAHGRAAHSSTPHLGRSAISAMGNAISTLDRFFARHLIEIRHPDFGPSTGSIGLIRGGSGINIVPDYCEISVDVRLLPGQNWEETYNAIQQCIASECRQDDIEWVFQNPPFSDTSFFLEPEHSLVQNACRAVGSESSHVVNFSCDASKIAQAGIPCIIFGPGDIAQAHTADESIPIEDLYCGVHAYVKMAETLLPVT